MSNTKHSLLEGLLDELARSQNAPKEDHICPICGGELRVYFSLYKSDDKMLLGGYMHCPMCSITVFGDYYDVPLWAKEINHQSVSWSRLKQLKDMAASEK